MTSVATQLRGLLTDEHAAIYAYGVLGARLGTAERRIALGAFEAHRATRDALRTRLIGMHVGPPEPAVAYDVTVTGPPEARALALRIEEQLGVRWHDLVGSTVDRGLRALAVQGLQDCAIRAAQWRRAAGATPTVAFPGS